jgi:hypothetical protein
MSQSNEADMERGIAQVLYNFGPGNIFDFGKYDLVMKVAGFRTSRTEELPTNRIASSIKSRARHFRNWGESPWTESLSGSDIEGFRPWKVEGELFPLTMVCSNQDCRRLHTREEPENFYGTPDGVEPGSCEVCGSRLQQLPFVVVHECGEIYPVRPTEDCDEHPHSAPVLKEPTNDPATWSFRCEICGGSMGYLGNYCEECHEQIGGATPPGGGGIFYPQTLILVDIPPIGIERDEIERGETWAQVLAAVHLDTVGMEGDRGFGKLVANEKERREFQEMVDEEGYTDQEVETHLDIREKQGEEVDHLRRDPIVDRTGYTFDPLRIGSEEDAARTYSIIGNQLYTFHRATNSVDTEQEPVNTADYPEPIALSNLLERDEFVERYPKSRKYQEKLEKINVNEVWAVDNFPLLNVLYGYSRETPEASDSDLRKFPHPEPSGDDDSIPVFADRTPSEAIILKIDRQAILDWLVENNDVPITAADVPEDGAPEAARKEWFLNNIDYIATSDPFASIEDPVSSYVYTLLHSMSHALVSTASDQCGLETDSISEMIMPAVPAIALYAKSTEHFALGGMFTLFKTRIHPWVDHTIDFADRCLFDPACINDEGGAACHACLHLNPVSCESMNQYLDRQLLVGGPDSPAFWNV